MTGPPNASASAWRHYGGFILAGGLAFATDAIVLEALTRGAGWNPLIARPVGIALAMIVSWLINRTVTFPVCKPATVREFAAFAAVSWMAQAVNYGVFAALLQIASTMRPVVALAIACLVSMIVSYAGFRFGVFRGPRNGA
jgi:putative flippase GtrA